MKRVKGSLAATRVLDETRRDENEKLLLGKQAYAYTDTMAAYRGERKGAWNIWLRAVRVSAKPILFHNVGNIVIARAKSFLCDTVRHPNIIRFDSQGVQKPRDLDQT